MNPNLERFTGELSWTTEMTGRAVQLEARIAELESDVAHWKGNHKRNVQLKREANARIRILRDALRWAIDEAHAYGLDVTCYCEDSHQGVALGECPHGLCATVRTALERTGKRGMPK